MSLEVAIVHHSAATVATLSGLGGSVTILPAESVAVLSPHVSQTTILPDGSRIVTVATGPPGTNGSPPPVVLLSLAEYTALTPEEQMDGSWYVVPKTP